MNDRQIRLINLGLLYTLVMVTFSSCAGIA